MTDKAYNIRAKPPEHSISFLTFPHVLLPLFSSSSSLPVITCSSVSVFGSLIWMTDQHAACQRTHETRWCGIYRAVFTYPAVEVSDPQKQRHSPSSFVVPVFQFPIRMISNNFAQLDKNRAAQSFTVYRFIWWVIDFWKSREVTKWQ